MKKRILSGVQPSGNIHLGNYLGALRNWVALQHEYESFFCIVNLHAITLPQDPAELAAKTRELARIYLAVGIDPKVSTIFVQSDVPEHAELAWVLNCITRMSELERMTQFKEKARRQRENVGVGIFDYPVLMAADILLYQADLVPVGEDQKQHLELTRDLAERFNRDYGETFRVPEPFIPPVGARIMSLSDPTKKMSKSDDDEKGAVGLLDDPDTVRNKFRRAVTDSGMEIKFDEQRPAINNLLTIYQLLTGRTRQEIEERFSGRGYAQLKSELADVTIEFLRPLQERIRAVSDEELNRILAQGAERARSIAGETYRLVKERMGLVGAF
ncbi:MAG: tryptophan--tRNA ligase [Pyrinomonas sp.]|uniref:tryptophan--tRNA ligase n=1 Tax=Pyrinomonas sp. TaxID=2080306 RepID=UPI003325C2E5